MDHLELWLLVWAFTVVLNVVPVFMPPTWTLLVYFRVGYDLDVWPLAVFGLARFVTYVFWITVGTAATQSLRDVIRRRLGNGVAIVMQAVERSL